MSEFKIKNQNKQEVLKPISLIRKEFKDNLANLINTCNLPAFIIVPILDEFLIQMQTIEQQQYQMDVAAYHRKLAEQEEQKESMENVTENNNK